MFDHYSEDEVFALIVGGIIAIASWATWYVGLVATARGVRPRGKRWPLALAPLVCALLLYVVLQRWSAEDVRTDGAYILFYMVVGAAWLALFRVQLPLFGLSAREDVLERGNSAAAWVLAGALIGGLCCFAGGNVGNGPGWWVVLFSGLLSTATLMLLWWVVHLGSGLDEKVTIDRDAAAGLRAAGFFIGCGLILGRAVAGDWVSAEATFVEFARMAWPAAVLTGAVVGIERACPPEVPQDPFTFRISGWLPAIAYVGLGVIDLLAW